MCNLVQEGDKGAEKDEEEIFMAETLKQGNEQQTKRRRHWTFSEREVAEAIAILQSRKAPDGEEMCLHTADLELLGVIFNNWIEKW